MNKKKTIITVVCVVLAIALAAGGIAYGTNPARRTCKVFPVSDIAMTDYWGDNESSYGEVCADRVQSVYLSSTQQVTEVYVTEGQSVQPGDKLLAYDTTLSELEVSRKEIEIQQKTEELNTAKKRYNTLAGSTVYKLSAAQPETAPVRLAMRAIPAQEEPTYRLTFLANEPEESGAVETYARKSGAGTHDDPYLYVCADGIPYNEAFLRELGLLPELPDGDEPPDEGGEEGEAEPIPPVYVVFGITEGNKLDGKVLQAGGMCFTVHEGQVSFIVFDASDYIGRAFGEPKPADPPDDDNNGGNGGNGSGGTGNGNGGTGNGNSGSGNGNGGSGNGSGGSGNGSGGTSNGGGTTSTKPNGGTTTTKPNTTTPTGPSYAEIQAEKAELQQKIKDLDLNLRMAQVELKRMKQELSDGVVHAEMAGIISSVLDPAEAGASGQPIVKLAGGGGYFIEGSVSELELEKVYVGQSVSITSWETGMSYQGTVQSISQTPNDTNRYWGAGNPNASYYPFTVSVESGADFREHESVELKLNVVQEVSDAFYLDQPFVLEEEGRSYVYVANEDGTLEKRQILTGTTLWGSYIQIVSGLTLDDCVAFPYGKSAREGARTEQATLDELYSW